MAGSRTQSGRAAEGEEETFGGTAAALGGVDLREYEVHLDHKVKTTVAQAQMDVAVI